MPIPALDPYPMPTEPNLPANQVDWRADPARAVLLLHDMQRYFLAPFAQDESPFTELIKNARRIRDRAAELGVPVVYSAQPGGMDREQRGLLRDFWGPGMSKQEDEVAIVDDLRPAEGDLVLTKWRYSAFARSELAEVLRRSGRDQLIVCGVYAHVGCLMTAVDAFTMDIEPFLVADAVADFSADHHRLALEYAAGRCAAVVSSDQVLAALAFSRERDGYRHPETSSSLSWVTATSTNHKSAETFRVSSEIFVEASPEKVFEFVTDLPNSGRWSPECLGGTWVGGRPGEVGAVFAGRNRRAPEVVAWAPVVRGEWTTEAEVVESAPPHVFSWAMRDRAGRAQQSVWTFRIEPRDGGSVLTHAFWMGELTEGMRGIVAGMSEAEKRRFVLEWGAKIDGDLRATLARIKMALESA